MKTDIQIEYFLKSITYRTFSDWEMISIFCKHHHHPSPGPDVMLSDTGVTVAAFTEWYNDGFGSGDVVRYNGDLAIVSQCTTSQVRVVARLKNDGEETHLDEIWKIVPVDQVSHASSQETNEFCVILSKNNRQYMHSAQKLGDKEIPRNGSKVEFWGSEGKHGLGIVRSVDEGSGEIELFCYYLYHNGKLGYSMCEAGVVDLHSYLFEPMRISQLRRLYRELERAGKKWHDKLHRIEPLTVKVGKNEKYWYINDKMKLVMDIEKGTPTSHFRYIGGNYFRTLEEGMEYLAIIREVLNDRLSK